MKLVQKRMGQRNQVGASLVEWSLLIALIAVAVIVVIDMAGQIEPSSSMDGATTIATIKGLSEEQCDGIDFVTIAKKVDAPQLGHNKQERYIQCGKDLIWVRIPDES
jgi:Flp pilus assembly pilin Flp